MENNGLRNGLFSGIASILFSMILYFVNPEMMFGGVAYIGLLIPIYFMYRAATEEKAMNDGYLSFGEGLKVTFLVAVVAFLLSSLFSYILINFIDPSLIEVIREQSIAAAEKVAEMFGGNEEAMEAMEDQNFAPTLSSSLISYLVTLIIPGFPMALIVSAITKKNNNDFA